MCPPPFRGHAVCSNRQNLPDSLWRNLGRGVEIILDFHVFDIQDFDLLIGHPIEKLLMDALTQSELDVRIGKECDTLGV